MGSFADGLAPAALPGFWGIEPFKWGFIDKNGKPVSKSRFLDAKSFSEGYAPVCVAGKITRLGQTKSWGFIDRNFHMKISPQFEDADLFSEGLAKVRVNGKYGYVNPEGKIAITPQFVMAGDFSQGLAPAAIREQDSILSFGYIDTSGRFVIKPQFDGAEQFNGGWARVAFDRRHHDYMRCKSYWYIGFDGSVKWRPAFSNSIHLAQAFYTDGFDAFATQTLKNQMMSIAINKHSGNMMKNLIISRAVAKQLNRVPAEVIQQADAGLNCAGKLLVFANQYELGLTYLGLMSQDKWSTWKSELPMRFRAGEIRVQQIACPDRTYAVVVLLR
jgi:hypothetical protein